MSNTKNKILFFCTFPPPNTGQTIGTKLTFECVNECIGTADKINIVDKNRLSRKSGDFSLSHLIKLLGHIFSLFTKTISNNYETVYVVFGSTKFSLIRDVFYTFIIKTFSKAKLIAQLHSGNYGDNFQNGLSKRIFPWLLSRVDVLIFSSPMLNRIGDKIPASRTAYLPNMISSDIICTDEEIKEKMERKSRKSHFDIFYISNMIAEKGYSDLVKAAELFKKTDPENDFTVHLVGGWPSQKIRADFESELVTGNMENNVKIYGSVVDRKMLKDFFLLADVFVLPTYYPIEAQPYSIIEALNAATPVISTYHASIPDLIQNDSNGFLVQPKDTVAIAAALQKLTDREKWMKTAVTARESYKSNYDQPVIIPKIKHIFLGSAPY